MGAILIVDDDAQLRQSFREAPDRGGLRGADRSHRRGSGVAVVQARCPTW